MKTDPIHISGGQFYSINFHKIFFVRIKFLRTSSEYLTRYGQRSVVKTDPCLYFFEYSPGLLSKENKVLDIFNTDKKCF